MSYPALSQSEYLDRVERLLADIDRDDRASLLADLGDQLTDIPDGEILELLGSPEHFVAEYRASAGFAQSDPSPAAVPPSRSGSSRMSVAVLVVGLVGVFVVWFLSPATSEQSPLVSILSLAFPVAVLVIGALTVLRAVRARSLRLPGSVAALWIASVGATLVLMLVLPGQSGIGMVLGLAIALITAVLVQMALRLTRPA